MTLKLSLPSALIASIALGAASPALSQSTDDSEAATAPAETAPALPSMTEIEQAWQAGDFVTVREGLKTLAEQTGTPLALYRYGYVLANGQGGPRDLAGAKAALMAAADQNHAEAMTLMARLYLSVDPENPDRTEEEPAPAIVRDAPAAAALLSRAAALGHAEAQYYLAMLTLGGDGVAEDTQAGFTWMLAAARQQYTEAQYELSRLYSRGIGTETNTPEALNWLTQAAENNHIEGQYYLARAYETGGGVAQNMNEAIMWYRRAAENGLPIAQRSLGTAYLQGNGVAQNTDEGLRWLTTAAKAGEAGAMANLGLAYATGLGVEVDEAQAADWYNRASEYGLGRAKVALGRFYETGRGVEADTDRAIALYEAALETSDAGLAAQALGRLAAAGTLDGRIAPQRAIPWALYAAQTGDAAARSWVATQAEAGITSAQAGLAALYLDSDDTAAEGAALLEEAAKGGHAASQARLGEMYMTGTHVALDYIAAHKWFNIAATLGQTQAAERRETVSALMTPEDIAAAQTAARAWFETGQKQPPKTAQTVTVTE